MTKINTRPKCFHCGQHIRAEVGAGAFLSGELEPIHREILGIVREFGGQGVTSTEIFTVFVTDRRTRGLPLRSASCFSSRISELVGEKRLKLTRSGRKITYSII